jgi:hypothetical protein
VDHRLERHLVAAAGLLVGDALVEPLLAVELVGDVDADARVAGGSLDVRLILGGECRFCVPGLLLRRREAYVVRKLLVLAFGAGGEDERGQDRKGNEKPA